MDDGLQPGELCPREERTAGDFAALFAQLGADNRAAPLDLGLKRLLVSIDRAKRGSRPVSSPY